MQRILLFLIGFSPLLAMAQEKNKINWVSMEKAQELILKDPTKKIMIDVYTVWCGPCKLMTRNTFGEKKTIDYINAHYIAVKFNAETPDTVIFDGKTFLNPDFNPNANPKGRNSTHQFASIAANNGRLAYPTLVFLDPKLHLITTVPGYHTPEQLEPILHYINENAYQTKPYEDYLKTFKSSYTTP